MIEVLRLLIANCMGFFQLMKVTQSQILLIKVCWILLLMLV